MAKRTSMKSRGWILWIIVISQFCCTSLWFAGNGIMDDLIQGFDLRPSALGHLTSAVQLGFITGTLLFALATIADRFSPTRVFLISALIGSACNLFVTANWNGLTSLLVFRFLTGFFLAGIYPVGMKIAADHYQKDLGRSLGFLVGALVVGTAFPHLLKGLTGVLPWRLVMVSVSLLAAAGGFLMFLLVPDGPHRNHGKGVDLSAAFKIFRNRKFRSAAFGYFGHMWELYAFWAFIPFILQTHIEGNPGDHFNVPVMSFMIIGIGGPACVLGGYVSQKVGARKTAFTALMMSCICCIVTPFIFQVDSGYILAGFLILWGMVVIADSPLFSTMVAQYAVAEFKGTALTIVNSIGFTVTIISIQILSFLRETLNPRYIFIMLALGPLLGLYALYGNRIIRIAPVANP
jgi:predicted MFS family arabinose efflux permease